MRSRHPGRCISAARRRHFDGYGRRCPVRLLEQVDQALRLENCARSWTGVSPRRGFVGFTPTGHRLEADDDNIEARGRVVGADLDLVPVTRRKLIAKLVESPGYWVRAHVATCPGMPPSRARIALRLRRQGRRTTVGARLRVRRWCGDFDPDAASVVPIFTRTGTPTSRVGQAACLQTWVPLRILADGRWR